MNSLTQNTIFVAIDWADQTHAWHLENERTQNVGLLQQDAVAIYDWVENLRKQYPNRQFAMAIETNKGALISAILEHEDITIYPINPAALAAYRKAFAHGGGKNDPSDAMLLLPISQTLPQEAGAAKT